MPNASPRRRAPRGPLKALPGPAVDNRPARGYLAVVAAALGFFLYAVYLTPDPGFAGIWPLMATAPLGLLLTAPAFADLPSWPGPLVFSAGVALCGLANATLLGLLVRRLRAPGTRSTA
ncbi:SCO4225 family membrane protein [Streptomyces misionensis]|uniref:SCO4225 family membrane protein n=1 Tax=Streptomyces misionensis TaxID=67331 RepID=UPI0036CA4363